MFKGDAKIKKREEKKNAKALQSKEQAEAQARKQMEDEVRERLKNFKREEFENDIATSADIDHVKDMCKYLLSELILTARAPRIKHIRLKSTEDNPAQCEIRCGWDSTKKGLFDCTELMVKELDSRFGLQEQLLTDQPFLEAVDFEHAPFFYQRDETGQPIILFPQGDAPHDERDDPAYFDLRKSSGLSYIMHLGCSCRGSVV